MTDSTGISQISAEIPSAHPIFFEHGARKPHGMHIDRSKVGKFDGSSLCCVMNADSEFRSPSWQELCEKKRPPGRKGVTFQVCEAEAEQLRVFAHPDFHDYADDEGRERLFPQAFQDDSPIGGCIFFDYWRAEGYTVDPRRASPAELRTMPKLQAVACGHLVIADLYLMFHGQMLAEIDQRVRAREIVMERRLVARQKRQDNPWNKYKRDLPPHDFVRLLIAVTLNGACTYQLELSFLDSCAIHGPVSFGTLCSNVNLKLQVKDEVKDRGLILRMDDAMYTDYDTILKYLDDDKHVHEALRRHQDNTAQLYRDVGVSEWWKGDAKLTVGKATQLLFQAVLERECKVDPGRKGEAARNELLGWKQWATAEYLASYVHETIMLLAKVEGGRCRNNRLRTSWLPGPLADIDISGCYGKGLALQAYPLGKPLLIGFPLESPRNAYPSLAAFLHMLEDELVPGLWHARVSLAPGYRLTYPQDFLGSWFDYRIQDVREQLCSSHVADFDDPIEALDVRSGCLKILRHDVQDAVITHDFLEWLRLACAPAQRQELLSHLEVKCALIYPKHDQVNTLDELRHGERHHKGRNRFTVKRTDGILRYSPNREEYHGWYAFNMGELLVNQLLDMRNSYRKDVDEEKALNTLLKLYINSLYGDSVSPHFATSDMCVGNNVTARARAMAWYMEKGFHTVQTITDGGQFELNGVIDHGSRRVNAYNVLDLSRDERSLHHGNLQRKPLGDCERIDVYWTTDSNETPMPVLSLVKDSETTRLEGKKALQWIDTTALDHLRKLWPGASVLDSFTFETKMVYDRGSFHGSANYMLECPLETVVKMRSYERKQHYALEYTDGALRDVDFYSAETPAHSFLTSLFHPQHISRQKVFAKSLILKDGDYRARYEKVYQYSLLHPGCTVWKVGLLREFSLSQFTFDTVEQFRAIKRQWELHKNKYGQFVECLFSQDDWLDYATMIEAVDRIITSGSHTLMEDLDPGYNTRRLVKMEHPAFETLAYARLDVAKMQGIYHEEDVQHGELQDSHAEHSYDHKPASWFDYDEAAAD